MYSNKKIVQSLGEIFKKKNISHFVISPGSRNAPIIIHFSGLSFFKTYNVVDERSAAFFALGMARELERPVVLNCTSGSAVANYYPALTEAFYQNIPLIVLSADLPRELIDVFDGQSIRQKNIFKSHTVSSIEIDENSSELTYQERLINQAINEAIYLQRPIHINLLLSEPLYETSNELSVNPKIIDLPKKMVSFQKNDLEKYRDIWKKAKKKLILVGQHKPDKVLENYLIGLSRDPSVVILTESLANLNPKNFISAIDKMILPMGEEKWQDYTPELLISLGKNIISKKIKLFLRKYKPSHHWHLDPLSTHSIDTYESLSVDWRISIEEFSKHFICNEMQSSNYQQSWKKLADYRKKRHDLFLTKVPFCDLKVFDCLLKKIPEDSILELGNSTTIRYQQLFFEEKNFTYRCNRGTSGIDGSLSSAIGGAVVSKKNVVLILGDISFFYDSNGMWNNYTPSSFRVILINNGGGNIFRFIPGPDTTEVLETHFETKHFLDASYLCQMHKWGYFHAKDEISLQESLKDFWNPKGTPKLLEIDTKDFENAEILKNYYEFIK